MLTTINRYNSKGEYINTLSIPYHKIEQYRKGAIVTIGDCCIESIVANTRKSFNSSEGLKTFEYNRNRTNENKIIRRNYVL